MGPDHGDSDHRDRGDHGHGHSHDHEDDGTAYSHLSPMDARVRALETLLTDRGLVDPAALDAVVERYEHEVGPRGGAQVAYRVLQPGQLRAAYRPRAEVCRRAVGARA